MSLSPSARLGPLINANSIASAGGSWLFRRVYNTKASRSNKRSCKKRGKGRALSLGITFVCWCWFAISSLLWTRHEHCSVPSDSRRMDVRKGLDGGERADRPEAEVFNLCCFQLNAEKGSLLIHVVFKSLEFVPLFREKKVAVECMTFSRWSECCTARQTIAFRWVQSGQVEEVPRAFYLAVKSHSCLARKRTTICGKRASRFQPK